MRRIIMLAIAVAVVLSAAGIGYAVNSYSGTTTSTSPVIYDGYSINIVNRSDDTLLTEGIELTNAEPDKDDSVAGFITYSIGGDPDSIESYRLKVSRDMDVAAMVIFDDARSWWLIDTISITVYKDNACQTVAGSYSWTPAGSSASGYDWASWATGGTVWVPDFSHTVRLLSNDANYLDVEISYRTAEITVSTSENAENPDAFLALHGKIVFTGTAPSS